jgi:hypothetical protein
MRTMRANSLLLGLPVLLLFASAGGSALQAQAVPPDVAVPAPLQPWVPWVLQSEPERVCSWVAERAVCHWPGQLELELDTSGGRFAQQVLLDRKLTFALPGSAERWPSAVRVDGRPAPVLDRAGTPAIELVAGSHRIEGRFAWKALPERLELPATTALVALRVSGRDVPFPRRDEQGQLWLTGAAAGDEQGEQLGLTVTRKLQDGVPLIATTRIKLRVAGRAREVSLGRVLLDGTAPLELTSELPARLEPDGSLRLQVRAGTYTVELRARSEGSPERLAFRSASAAWPESEVWVWQADETLRQVELRGAPPVDPARTELERDWHGLPAFALRAGAALELVTVRRGEPSPPPNQLTLERELWLDLDGRGYTVRDRIRAELKQGFRLDLARGELGHVSADGEDLLITKDASGQRAGVELRKAAQDLLAEWRAPDRLSSLPAVGWSEDVQSLSTTLHLGPGYSVFAARGVDGVSQSWLQDWDLFDFFFVLVVAAAVARLAGRGIALLALLALVLCHDEAEAPAAVWLALLAAIALLRVLPAGWFRNAVRVAYGATVIVLLLIALPFAVAQVRAALYPQLGGFGGFAFERAALEGVDTAQEETPATPEPAQEVPASAPIPMRGVAKEAADGEAGGSLADTRLRQEAYDASNRVADVLGKAAGVGVSTQPSALRQDPEATVQTGPGVPTWQWRSWQLTWSGPVDKAHEIDLYLMPPALNRTLALLRVLLLAALIALLLRAATPGRDRPGASARPDAPSPKAPAVSAAGALLLALCALPFLATPARAQLPDQALLDQLRERLTEPAECRPQCASIDEMLIRVAGGRLELALQVHAGERTSVRLPGPAAAWVPAEIRLDGRTAAPAIVLGDGFVHVRLEPGIHAIDAVGPLPPSDTLTLAISDVPHRARVQAEGWKVDGVREDGRVEGALQLSRSLAAGEDARALESAALPPWLLLERRFELGPSWQIHTRLVRVSPTGTPIRARVPLLPGESVTEAAFEVKDGEVQVSLGRDEGEIVWSSRLAPRERIELAAAVGRPWTERWTLLCGPMWHCEPAGLTPTARLHEGLYRPSWTPWPGERVNLRVLRPAPAPGQSITIDSAQLEVTPGVRMQQALLALRIRSSRGGSQPLRLPKGARVQSLTVDGAERPLRVERDGVAFTLEPGAHSVELRWQEPIGMSAVQRAPRVELGRAAANARVVLHMPQDRWLLWVSGPSWGPAVLFWGYLLLALGAALLLSRAGRRVDTPLRVHEWLLLAIGLTQVPAPAALCVALWFFALAQRGAMPEQRRFVHNLLQIGLVLFSWAALGCLYAAVHAGLLLQPDMQVAGASSHAGSLNWYTDRVANALPAASAISAPLWLYRVLMLLWSLWLASRLLRWLRWAFACMKHGGLWRSRARIATPAPP